MDDLPAGVTHWEGPGLDAWEPWTPREVADRLASLAVPWQVVGGWAIDLFVGRRTRDHEDLEIAVLRDDLGAVRAALGVDHELFSVGDGEVLRLEPTAEAPPDKHQNWVLDPVEQKWRVDVMLEPGDGDTWVFRRDPSITAPRAAMARTTPDGVPYVAPTGALLYKAKAAREKDQADFDVCLPRLDDEERAWLVESLRRAHPGHPWLDRLDG